MDFTDGIILGAFVFAIFAIITVLVFAPDFRVIAEFVCESEGLELIDFEIEGTTFSKVECGNKKPELQYDNYKVFTK